MVYSKTLNTFEGIIEVSKSMSYIFLLFDLDHTLLDFDAAEDVALSHLLKEEGVKDIQAYKDYYVPMNKTLWKDLELKKITKQELVNTRFSRLFAHFGIEKDGAYLAERYQFFLSKQGQIFPGVEDLLKKLIHQGYELYAATNGITYIQTGRLEQSGIAPFFKEIFISEQLHTQKPDAAFYEKIGTRISNFDKHHALMIGDSLSADIQGGNNAGIDTVWYNPDHLENNTQAQPTYEVDSYQALLEILDKL
jgi:HAD hydrolase, TIGR02254 family